MCYQADFSDDTDLLLNELKMLQPNDLSDHGQALTNMFSYLNMERIAERVDTPGFVSEMNRGRTSRFLGPFPTIPNLK